MKRSAWRIAAAALTVLPMAYWSVQIASAMRWHERIAQFELAHRLAPTQRISFGTVYAGEVPGQCERISVSDFNDPWSAAYLAKLAQGKFTPIAVYRSRFGRLATSTLHTYLDADVHYFRCP